MSKTTDSLDMNSKMRREGDQNHCGYKEFIEWKEIIWRRQTGMNYCYGV
jgi:hypothetical protein